MKKNFPISFYIKLLFIVISLSSVYYYHEEVIDQAFSQKNLSIYQQLSELSQKLIGFQTQPKEEYAKLANYTQSFPGNKEPIQYHPLVLNHPHFILGQKRADLFNQQLDLKELNRAFIEEANRNYFTQAPLQIASNLTKGNHLRLDEITNYAYLDSKTFEGLNFRQRFPDIADSEYRIGENLYEVFISADDIHIDTWSKKEAVFAKYLANAFFGQTEELPHLKSLILSARASASDFHLDDSSYVRIAVVLNFDNHNY
ncbi:hypothetical protein [Facklamia miroungae]|uniref:Uncharacterized conserved protein YkwD, contains CAP (CSP/antigen 5/PR1) domain n=1 Tax=Facklamia miroungae TaxID=120956 RepID=A0A1G7U6D6_9LACT|nr:hypothetical protein [Facklamia miroungae]NKZ29923.1 hypothetical protein [Facklamia miroungae]SDG42821.1 Uncharacterized conserved protein YkwD, contains CAP (CSP/antigen 5/PR1) domain [Facklamia miroungae]